MQGEISIFAANPLCSCRFQNFRVFCKMPVQTVTDTAAFKKHLSGAGDKLVVADFFATWCAPCADIAPHFDRFSEEYKGSAIFLRVDIEENPDLTDEWKVISLPTFVFFRAGHEVDRFLGAVPEDLGAKLKRWIGPKTTSDEDATTTAKNFLKTLVGLPVEGKAAAFSSGSFSGKGNRLGSAAEAETEEKTEKNADEKSSAESSGWLSSLKNLLPYGKATDAVDVMKTAQEQLGVKSDKPTTSVQVRLENNSKLKLKLNLDHSVAKIREFIVAVRPEYKTKEFALLAPQPFGGPIQDENVSIKDAKLENSMVTLKIIKK